MIERGKRGALEISFGWLFAIIAGIVIIALAIFFVTKFVNLQQTTMGAETGKEIGILLNPLETSFETAKTTKFTIPTETIIHNICQSDVSFGSQRIMLSQKNLGKWTDTNVQVSFENKYIFSDADIQGNDFYVFSKPFEFPFKVADLIYLTSSLKEYCFVNSPAEIDEELSNLNQTNIFTDNCPENSIRVCFGAQNCDINVDYGSRYVRKDGKSLYFETDALMYAGVFSEPEIYECQLKRLMKRTEELSSLYKGKSDILSGKGCPSSLDNDLIQLNDFTRTFETSKDIISIGSFANELKRNNEISLCRLW